ncbi:segregation and condensation protein B [Asanoa hainanensis]|uniref:Segregation and condensation protein B n=1 Tax=Asanoa hainanensis TaxID=560556 RepID=A0A239NZ42_9ACTN|nr:SMC-Scp complex subunit ScpB [Asanoa hainanensis]SNT60151.1 segregation and condensation protein B [Asanoa hainanensis]
MTERGGADPGREASLAEQAAAWVPPWERPRPQPEGVTESEGAPEPEPAEEPELAAEADTIEAAEAIGDAEEVTAPEEQDPVVAAELPEAPPDAADLVDLAEEADPGTTTDRSAAEVATPAPSRVSDADVVVPAIDEDELRGALEAIMLVVDEPVQEIVLAQVLELPTERVQAALESISAGYTSAGHGFELRRAAGGWRLYTRPQYAAYVEKFVLDGQSVRLTQAALETLAVIAYKQPVTRGRISAIRGVNCDGVVRTLTARGLVEEAGTEPETGAYLYRTTTLFLEKLGLDTVDQLPDLAPFLPDDVDEVADGER